MKPGEKLGLLHRISSVRLSKGCYLRYVGRMGAPIIRKRWGHIWKTDRNLVGAANNQNKFQEVRCHCNAIRGRRCQLYERDNFVGQAVTIERGRKANMRDFKCIKTGTNLSARRTMDNIATSAYVPRGCRMVVTDRRGQKGRRLVLRAGLHARLPRGWNDRISWAGCSCIR